MPQHQPLKPVQLDGPGLFLLPEIAALKGLVFPAQAELSVHLRLATQDGRELDIPMTPAALESLYRALGRHLHEEKH